MATLEVTTCNCTAAMTHRTDALMIITNMVEHVYGKLDHVSTWETSGLSP